CCLWLFRRCSWCSCVRRSPGSRSRSRTPAVYQVNYLRTARLSGGFLVEPTSGEQVMFAAPRVIETKIFATLPEELRIRSRKSELSKFVDGEFDSFLEGPSFDRLGNLYCVDLVFGRIFRVDTKGEFHVVVEYDGEPNGLKIHRDGRLFVADRRHGVIVIDPSTKRIQNILERYDL